MIRNSSGNAGKGTWRCPKCGKDNPLPPDPYGLRPPYWYITGSTCVSCHTVIRFGDRYKPKALRDVE